MCTTRFVRNVQNLEGGPGKWSGLEGDPLGASALGEPSQRRIALLGQHRDPVRPTLSLPDLFPAEPELLRPCSRGRIRDAVPVEASQIQLLHHRLSVR